VSPISAWELALASRKRQHPDRPDFGSNTPATWFAASVAALAARMAPIDAAIAVEAAEVVVATGHKDPGDCHLIATARVNKVPIVTRDRILLSVDPAYLQVIPC
jgi:PIN domain nuclease of toxin-antitoxin system